MSSAASCSTWSAGSDCQTRRDNAPSAASACQNRRAPIQPSLSWTDVTPAPPPAGLAHRVEVLPVRDVDVPIAEPPALLARTPVASPEASRSTTPPSTSRSPSARESAAELIHRVRVMGKQRNRHLAGYLVERLLRRRRGRSASRQPRPRSQPPSGTDPSPSLTRQRLLHRGHALQPDLPLSDRPRREVDMCVREAREDAAPRDRPGRGSVAPPRASRPRPRSGHRRSRARTQSEATAPASCNASLENHGRKR